MKKLFSLFFALMFVGLTFGQDLRAVTYTAPSASTMCPNGLVTVTLKYANDGASVNLVTNPVTLDVNIVNTTGVATSTPLLTFTFNTGTLTPGNHTYTFLTKADLSNPGIYSFNGVVTPTGGELTPVNNSFTDYFDVQVPTLSYTSGTLSQIVCRNTPITPIVYAVGGSATDATVSGLPAGVSAVNDGAGNITISGTPSAAGSFTYDIVTTGGACLPQVSLTGVGTLTVNALPNLTITNPAAVCSPATADISAGAITVGSTAGLTLTYWTDALATSVYATPATATAGTYYIKGTDASSCFDIKSVVVTVNTTPTLTITNPAAVCSPATANISAPAVTAGSTGGLTLTYWTDALATASYGTPTLATAGTYYIKGTISGCFDIKPVVVTVNTSPTLAITNPSVVCSPATANISAGAVTVGSTGGLTLTYWTDALATASYGTPAAATAGTYYIKGTDASSCFDIKPVVVTVNTPALTITNPAAVCSPATSDISAGAVTVGSTVGLTLTYWSNAIATIAYGTPATATSGTYYIKGTDASSCFDIKPVLVTVNTSPTLTITNPSVVCSPSTANISAGAVTVGSTGGLTLTYWTNAIATISYGTPAVATAGTYYIKGTDASSCFDIKPVVVTVNSPSLTITNPSVVCSPATANISAGSVTVGSTGGLTLTYWTDALATAVYGTPATATAGTYYIKGTDASSCFDIKPVVVTVNNPLLTITNPATVCSPATANISAAPVTAGSTVGLTLTYWTDALATAVYGTPATATAGTYYIKGTDVSSCFDIKPVVVTVNGPTLTITNPAAVCSPATANISAGAVTVGSTGGLTLTYWTNAIATIAYGTPATATAGTYYIKGTDGSACYDVKPVVVTVNSPSLTITNPSVVCSPATANISAGAVTVGSTVGLTLTYWTDALATAVYGTPATATAGTYYIKGTDVASCFDIKPVVVTVNTPTLTITNPAAVCSPATASISAGAVTVGSTAGLTLTYWTDALATASYATPAVATAGTYYIKGTDASSCFDIKPVVVSINNPILTITNPSVVCAPSTADISAGAVTVGSTGGLTLTYWTDALATASYATPAVATAGTYYIKGTDVTSCSDIKPVVVTVNNPNLTITNPTAVCSPSTSDITAGAVTVGSTVGLTYTYWTNVLATLPYGTPATATAGTYFIKGTDAASCFDIKSVVVSVNPIPVYTAIVEHDATSCVTPDASIDITGLTPSTAYVISYTNPLGGPVTSGTITSAAGTGNIIGSPTHGTLSSLASGSYSNFIIKDFLTQCQTAPATVNLNPANAVSVNLPAGPYTACVSAGYPLPAITGNASFVPATAVYSTLPGGPSGGGTIYTAGQTYHSSGTLYVYDIDNVTGCSDEKSFVVTLDQLPTATALGSSEICSSSSATASGLVTDGTYSWAISGVTGGGSITSPTSSTPTYNAVPSDAGKTVVLILTGTSNTTCVGATATANYNITVDNTPTATGNLNKTICSNSSASALPGDYATTDVSAVTWSVSPGASGTITPATVNTLTPTYNASPLDPSTVTLTMHSTKAVGNQCSNPADVTFTINVDQLPVATLVSSSAASSICHTGSHTMPALNATTANGTRLWTVQSGFGSITPLSSTTLTPTYNAVAADAGTTVTLLLTVTSTNACSLPVAATATATYTIAVDASPTAVTNGPKTICSNLNSYTLVGGDATAPLGNLLWTVQTGAGSISAGSTTLTPTYTFAPADAGTSVVLNLAVTSTNACLSPAPVTYTINVNALPTASTTGVPTSAICPSATATITSASALNGNIAWNVQSGFGSISLASINTANPVYTPTNADAGTTVILRMTVTSNNSCALPVPATAFRDFTFNVNSIPSFGLTPHAPTSCVLSDGKIDVTGLTPLTTYTIDYTSPSLATVSASHTTDGGGVYQFTGLPSGSYTNFKVTDASGCFATDVVGTSLIAPGAIDINPIVNQNVCISGAGYARPVITGTNIIGSADLDFYTLPGGPLIVGGNPLVSFPVAATSTIYIYGSKAGCSDQESFTVTVDPLPTANVVGLGSHTICSNGSYTLGAGEIALTNCAISSWSENGSGSITAGGNSLQPTYQSVAGDAGLTRTLTLHTTSTNTCANPSDANYLIVVNPLPTASTTGPIHICETTVSYTLAGGAATATGGTINWTHDGFGSISAGNGTVTPTYTLGLGDAGKTVHLTMVVSDNTCTPVISASAIYSIIVDQLPTAVSGGSKAVCSNLNSYTLVNGEATATNGAILWSESSAGSISANPTLTTPTYTFAPADAGTSVVLTMTVTSSNTCPSPAPVTYTIHVDPIPTASISGSGNQTICSTSSAIVSGATASNGTILWSHNGHGTITLGTESTLTPEYNPTAADEGNTVTLTMTVTSNNSCGNVVLPAPTYLVHVVSNPTVTLTSALGTNAQIVPVSTAITPITYNVIGVGPIAPIVTGLPAGVTYNFAGGVMTISGTNTGLPGTYFYTVMKQGICTSASAVGSITIPQPLSGGAGGGSTTICSGLNKTLIGGTATGGNGVYTYSWRSSSTITGPFTSNASGINNSANYTTNFLVANTYYKRFVFSAGLVDSSLVYSVLVDVTTSSLTLNSPFLNSQNVCVNSALVTPIDYSFGPTTLNATTSGLPAGLVTTLSVDGLGVGHYTISGTPSQAGTFNYTVTTIGSCGSASATGIITVNSPITVAPLVAPVPSTICSGTSTVLNGNVPTAGGNGVYTYTWLTSATTGGPYLPASGVNSAINYSTPNLIADSYYVLSISSGACSIQTSEIGIIMDVTLAPTLTLNAPFLNAQNLCKGSLISTPIAYTFGGNAINATVSGLPTGVIGAIDGITGFYTITGTPSVLGTFNYTVSTTGTCGLATATGTLSVSDVIVKPLLSANPSTICEGTSTSITSALPTGGNGTYSFSWFTSQSALGVSHSVAPGISSTLNFVTDTLKSNRYFTRIISSGGCIDSSEVLITVEKLPIAAITGATGSTCYNSAFTVPNAAASITNGVSYVWTEDGAGSIPVLQTTTTLTPTYTPTIADAGKNVTLTLTLTSNNSCGTATDTATFVLSVNALPDASLVGLTTSTICHSDSLHLNGIALHGTPSWTHNGAGVLSSSTIVNPYYNPAVLDAGKTVTLNFIVSDLTCTTVLTDTAKYLLNIYALPTEPVNAGLDDTVSLGSSIQLHAKGSSIVTWNWKPSISLDDEFVASPIASPLVTTSYSVIATHLNGCTSRDTVNIVVLNDHQLLISNMMSPNGDGKNDTWGIGNIENYPGTEVIVVNREGEIVFESQDYKNEWDGKYKGKYLPDATYYYIVKFADSDKVYKGAITLLHGSK